jgi:hypothetical protein
MSQRGATMPKKQKSTSTSGLVFGNVKHPAYKDRLIPDFQNYAWDDLGQRWVAGVCLHTMVGTLLGTDVFFRQGANSPGLTDYGIGGETDGEQLDGVIYRWNDPLGHPHPDVSANRWGWASGPCNGMEGDGPAFVKKYGANAVNGYLVSIERSDGGNPDRAPSSKYLNSCCNLIAYWADQAKIPWTSFPINPATGLTFVYGHWEFSIKSCPAGVRAWIGLIIERVRDILKAAQIVIVPPSVEEDPLADFPKSDVVLNSDTIWPNYGQGTISQAWAEYGSRTGIFNPPGQPWGTDEAQSTKLYCFEGGPCFDEHGKLVVKVK